MVAQQAAERSRSNILQAVLTCNCLLLCRACPRACCSDRFLPDKAIDLIDEAGSRVRLRHIQLPEEARELDKELKQVRGDCCATHSSACGTAAPRCCTARQCAAQQRSTIALLWVEVGCG